MKRALDAFVSALAYFTILPVGNRKAPGPDALAALPYAGALVGALTGAAAWAVSFVGSQALVVAAAFGAAIVLTGAIHVDGFLDTCDALFASVTPQRRLEILKDPRHGTFAIAGFAVVVVVWLAALRGFTPAQLPASLAFAAALARWGAVLNALVYPSAPGGSSSSALAAKPPIFIVGITGVLLGAAAWCFGSLFIVLVPTAAALALLVGRGLRASFGGLSGDLYGFVIVVLETGLLVALEAMLAAGV